MLSAAWYAWVRRSPKNMVEDSLAEAYRAMLSAAPAPPTGQEGWRTDEAPLDTPLWGWCRDPGTAWTYGTIYLVERVSEEGQSGWFLQETGEEIDSPAMWAASNFPAAPTTAGEV